MAKTKIILIPVAILIGVTSLVVFLLPWAVRTFIDEPYQRFLTEEKEAYRAFSRLNEQVFSSVPVPPGVLEIERHQRDGQSAAHGAPLDVLYQLAGSSIEEVMDFYKEFFQSNSWEQYQGYPFLYYKELSCFQISPSRVGFTVKVAHDYLKHELAPTLPPNWVLTVAEFGETTFLQCPPLRYVFRTYHEELSNDFIKPTMVHAWSSRVLHPTNAPNTACSGRWGICAFSSSFHASTFFPFGRLRRPRPSATNASRWAFCICSSIDQSNK